MFLEWLFLESSFPDEVTTPWRTLASSEDQRCILLSPQEGAPIISTDWGTQFNPISYPLSSGYNPYTFVSPTGQRMLFFNRNDSYQSGSSIYSHDYGSSWNPTISTVSSKYDINPELRFFGQGESCAVSADGSTVIVVFRDNREGNTNGHIWISRDYGVSFTDFAIINNGYHVSSKRISSCISANGQFQYISTSYNGIHRSVDGGQTWTRTYNRNSSPGVIQTSGDGSVVIEVNTLTRTGVLSSDYGSNWKSISIPNLPNTTAIAISLQGDIIYCSGYGSVYYSTDLGNNWLISSIVEGTPLAVQFGGICTSPSGTNLLTVQINQGLWKGYTVTVPEQKYDPPLELEEIYNRSWSNIRWARKGEKLTGVSSSFDVIELQQAPDVRMMFDVWTNTYVLADEISKVSLSGLQDVDLTGAQENSALVWNGSEWDTSFRIDDSVVDSATVWSSQRLNEIKLLDLANVIGPIEEGRVFVRHGFDWIEGFSLTDGTEDQDVVWSSEYFRGLVDSLSLSTLYGYDSNQADNTGYLTYIGEGLWTAQYSPSDYVFGYNFNKNVYGIGNTQHYYETGVEGIVQSATGNIAVYRKFDGSLYRTFDGGFTWSRMFYEEIFGEEYISPLSFGQDIITANIYRLWYSGTDGAWYDIVPQGGTTWINKEQIRTWTGVSVSDTGQYQTAVAKDGGQIYTSSDYGDTWVARGSYGEWRGVSVSGTGQHQIMVMWGNYIYVSSDYGNSRTSVPITNNWQSCAVSGNGDHMMALAPNAPIHVSADYGVTWSPTGPSLTWWGGAISYMGQYQTAVAFQGNIYVSVDYGSTWLPKDQIRNWTGVSVSVTGQYQTAVALNGQIYTSSDYGDTWVAKGPVRSWRGVEVSRYGEFQAAVADNDYIYVSSDYGNTWNVAPNSKGIIRNWRGIAMERPALADKPVVVVAVAEGDYIRTPPPNRSLWYTEFLYVDTYYRSLSRYLNTSNWVGYSVGYTDSLWSGAPIEWNLAAFADSIDWVSVSSEMPKMTFMVSYCAKVIEGAGFYDRVGHGYVVILTEAGNLVYKYTDKPRNWVGVKKLSQDQALSQVKMVLSHHKSPKNINDSFAGEESSVVHAVFSADGEIVSQQEFTNIGLECLSLIDTGNVLGSDGEVLYEFLEGDSNRQYSIQPLSGFPSTPKFTAICDNSILYGNGSAFVIGYFSSYMGYSEVPFLAERGDRSSPFTIKYIGDKEGRAHYVTGGVGNDYIYFIIDNTLIRVSTAHTPSNKQQKVFSNNISIKGTTCTISAYSPDSLFLVVLDNGELHVSTDFTTWEVPHPERFVERAVQFNKDGYLSYVVQGDERKIHYDPLTTHIDSSPFTNSVFYMDYSGRVIVSPKLEGGFTGILFSTIYLKAVVEKDYTGVFTLTNPVYYGGFLVGAGSKFYFWCGGSEGYYLGVYNLEEDVWSFLSIPSIVDGASSNFCGSTIAYISNSTLFTSFDSGLSWEESTLPNVSHVDVSLDGKLLFAVSGLSPNRIAQVSADRGQTWNLLFDQEEAITITSFLNGFGILIKGINKHWFSFDFGSTWTEYGTSGLMILPSESGRKFLVLDSGTLTIYSGEVESNHQFQLDLDLVPTSDPGRPGVIWRDGTTLKVSV